MTTRTLAAAFILFFSLYFPHPTLSRTADPNILWTIIHDQCGPSAQHIPCLAYHQTAGYALLKDIVGATQILLIPTARVTGIEDPQVLAPNAPDYFLSAWNATRLVQALAHTALPPQDLSLAINSPFARTQNQLHIHIDCLKPDIAAQIRTHAAYIGDTWAPFPGVIGLTPYRAMRVFTLQQSGNSPFQLLSRTTSDMSQETLAVVGATSPTGEPEFILLESRYDPAIPGSGGAEELQDHSCAVAHEKQ